MMKYRKLKIVKKIQSELSEDVIDLTVKIGRAHV